MWSSLRMIVKYAFLIADNSYAIFIKNDIHAISNELPVVIKNTCSFSKLIFSLQSSQWQWLGTLNGERILNDCWTQIEHSVSEYWTLCEHFEHESSEEHKAVSYKCRVIQWWTYSACTINSERTVTARWIVNARWGNGKRTQKWKISCRIWKSRRRIVSKSTMVKCIVVIANRQQTFQQSVMKAMSN